MKKTQLEKIRKDFESMDMSRYHILTYDELLRVNGGSGSDSSDDDDTSDGTEDSFGSEYFSDGGSSADNATETSDDSGAGAPTGDEPESGGHEIENTFEAVANAEVGDTLTRDDGTEVTITQGDIDWAQEHCDSYGKNEEAADSKEAGTPENLPTAEESGNADSGSMKSDDNFEVTSHAQAANMQPGETITLSDGSTYTMKEGDIEYERNYCDEHGIDWQNSGKEAGENKSDSSKENSSASNLLSEYSNLPAYPDYSEEVAYMNSRLNNAPKESGSNTNWEQVKNGAVDMLLGIGGMSVGIFIEAKTVGIATAPAYALFSEGITTFCYGMAELGTGLQGGTLPPSTDLFLEQVTFGLAETGFDRR